MSTYEYECQKCKHSFSVNMTIKEHETKKVTCPKCKSTKIKWHPSRFFAVTSKKS